MPNTSSKTKPIAFRLPLADYSIIEKRANKRGVKVSDYVKAKLIWDSRRNH